MTSLPLARRRGAPTARGVRLFARPRTRHRERPRSQAPPCNCGESGCEGSLGPAGKATLGVLRRPGYKRRRVAVEEFMSKKVRKTWRNSPERKFVVRLAAVLVAGKSSRHGESLPFPSTRLLCESYAAGRGASTATAGELDQKQLGLCSWHGRRRESRLRES